MGRGETPSPFFGRIMEPVTGSAVYEYMDIVSSILNRMKTRDPEAPFRSEEDGETTRYFLGDNEVVRTKTMTKDGNVHFSFEITRPL